VKNGVHNVEEEFFEETIHARKVFFKERESGRTLEMSAEELKDLAENIAGE